MHCETTLCGQEGSKLTRVIKYHTGQIRPNFYGEMVSILREIEWKIVTTCNLK